MKSEQRGNRNWIDFFLRSRLRDTVTFLNTHRQVNRYPYTQITRQIDADSNRYIDSQPYMYREGEREEDRPELNGNVTRSSSGSRCNIHSNVQIGRQIDIKRQMHTYFLTLAAAGSSPSMQPLVFWPRAGSIGAGAILELCPQLLWCELYVMKNLPPQKDLDRAKPLQLEFALQYTYKCRDRQIYRQAEIGEYIKGDQESASARALCACFRMCVIRFVLYIYIYI